MPVQVIPDTDFFGPNIWRKRHSTRDRHCFSIPFRPTVKNGAPPARSKQRVAVKPTTHIALHPYPHIPSVCAYKLVTNTVRPSSFGCLVATFLLSRRVARPRPARPPPGRLALARLSGLPGSPRVASDIKHCSCLLDHTLHQDSLYPLFVFPTCNGSLFCVNAVYQTYSALFAEA